MVLQDLTVKSVVSKIPILRDLVQEPYEVKYTRMMSKNLLAVYKKFSRADRPLDKFDLYALVAANYLGCDIESGFKVVIMAEESFASWPVDRPVRFRDIVHYILIVKNINYNKNKLGWDNAYKSVIEEIVPRNY